MPTLTLTPEETLLKECLVDCAAGLVPRLEIRFAGGWVRDKLLNKTSNDIDVALSNLSGKDFGQHFRHFYNTHGRRYKAKAERLEIAGIAAELSKIVIVEEDAEKSKHLAVAKMKLFGLEVDLVNLRTEVYTENSRTPVVKMGTPKEDALRRDATINALFYNIHTETVEDFTEKGLDDLENKVMRTPLDPEQTFRDDPLRVLRLIRFASRLDFRIDEAAMRAMKNPVIHEALKLKISRERVRIEVIKALEGPNPAKALRYIQQLNLFAACFAHPNDPNPPSHNTLPQTIEALIKVFQNDRLTSGLQLNRSSDSKSLSWLLAVYVPWSTSSLPVASSLDAIKEGLKATVKESKLLEASLVHREEISSFVSSAATTRPAPSTPPPSRGSTGMFLRRLGPLWGHQFLFAYLCDLQIEHLRNPLPDLEDQHSSPQSMEPVYIYRRYAEFLDHLESLNLVGNAAIDAKPLLDGRLISEILDRGDKGRAGPGNKLAGDVVMEWTFDHPEDGTAEGCAEMLRAERDRILEWEREQMASKGGKKRKGEGG